MASLHTGSIDIQSESSFGLPQIKPVCACETYIGSSDLQPSKERMHQVYEDLQGQLTSIQKMNARLK